MTYTITDISALAEALIFAEADVDTAETNLKDKKESARRLREETIPGAMQELGIESIKLTTGQKLTVVQDVYASILAADRKAAYDWLNSHGFGGLIKTEVVVDFGKGEEEKVASFYQELKARGFEAEVEQGIHAATLKAFLREKLASGSDIPLDLFGARPIWTAKITKK